MARFDVYRNPDGVGFLLDLQADAIDRLSTRVVAPLLPVNRLADATERLNPCFDIGEVPHILHPQLMSAVPTRTLREPVMSLDPHFDVISNALDMLFIGY